MNTRMTRLVRGSVAATLSTFVALFSHVMGGGSLPSAAGLSLALAFAVITCMLLASRRASLWRNAVSIGLSQIVFHAVFSTMGGPRSTSSTPVDPMLGMHGATPADALLQSGGSAVHSSPSMWIAHAIAAALTVAAFTVGERAWSAIGRIARGILSILLPTILATPRALPAASQRAPIHLDVVPRISRVFLSPMRHRGPPAIASA